MLPDKPSTREELYLDSIATNNTAELPAKPCTRREQYLEYIALNGGGKGTVIVEVTGDSGTLTEEQIADVLKDDVTIECDGQMFRLANKMSTLTYRTFICVDAAQSSDLAVSAIYVQLGESAANYGSWSKEDVPTGGGEPEIVELPEESGGTLSAEQAEKISGMNTIIKRGKLYYRIASREGDASNYVVIYTCVSPDTRYASTSHAILADIYPSSPSSNVWAYMQLS